MARSPAIALSDILSAIDLARMAASDLPFKEFERDLVRRAAAE